MAELLKLKDEVLLEVYTDYDDEEGCETCDYGSCYSTEVELLFKNHTIEIHTSAMYEHCLSEGGLMRILLEGVTNSKNKTFVEFADWLKKELEDECDIQFEDFGSNSEYTCTFVIKEKDKEEL